jgi:hypothetical protein
MTQPINRFTVPTKPKLGDTSNITAVILSSIANDRMKTMPPVSLMMVDRQHTVLDVQIEAIRTVFPKCEIALVVGHDAQQVIDKKPNYVRVIENVNHETLGEVEELRLAINNCVTDNIILISGNCIFNANALQHLRGHSSCTLVDKKNQIDKDSLGVISNGGRVENIAYGVQDKWCYITYLESREQTILRKFVSVRNRSNLCMFEGINYVLSNGGQIYAIGQQDGYLRRVTSGKDLRV